MDEISRSLPGFTYGRYDVIAADEEAFCAGRDLKVIELNGVTSEATSLYDPKHNYLQMIRILLTQWREASEIGMLMQQRGHGRMKFSRLLQLYDQFRERENRHRLHLHLRRKKTAGETQDVPG